MLDKTSDTSATTSEMFGPEPSSSNFDRMGSSVVFSGRKSQLLSGKPNWGDQPLSADDLSHFTAPLVLR